MNPRLVYLTRTDTTVGFLSQDKVALAGAKKRDPRQPFLIAVDSLSKQKRFVRTPKQFKKIVRRAKKSTFVYPNKQALRVVREDPHTLFLKQFDFMFSTSANESGKPFSLTYAIETADVIVEDREGFHEGSPSAIYQLGKVKKKRLR